MKLCIKESSSDEYFVGIFKKMPRNDEFGDVDTNYYDDMFDFNNYQDAWEEAIKWNLKGYYVEFEEWKADEDTPDIKLFKPGEMKKYLNQPLKNESTTKRGRKRSTGNSNSVGSFLDRQIASGKIDEKQITVVYDKNNNIMWLGKAGFYPLIMLNVEYRSSGYDKDHPHEFWINARSYTEPFGESYKKRRTIKESTMDYLDTNERAIVDKLEQLGYRGSKPIKFDGKLMGYWDKVYYTDKKSSSGVQIYIDPFDGSVEVQEFVNDIDEENLTDLCPVKKVRSPQDVVKIDRWAKGIEKAKY